MSIPKSFLSFLMRVKNQLRFAWWKTTGGYLWNLIRIYADRSRWQIKNQLRLTWRIIKNRFNAKTFLVVIGISICCVLIILGLRMFDVLADFLDTLFGVMDIEGGLSSKTQTLRMLGFGLFGLFGVLGLIVAYLRAKALFEANQAVFQAN